MQGRHHSRSIEADRKQAYCRFAAAVAAIIRAGEQNVRPGLLQADACGEGVDMSAVIVLYL
jgi:hypothetical protein